MSDKQIPTLSNCLACSVSGVGQPAGGVGSTFPAFSELFAAGCWGRPGPGRARMPSLTKTKHRARPMNALT